MKIPKRARQKILNAEQVRRAVRSAQRRGERVVFTNGCFDLLHLGHVRSLEEASRLGDHLVVAINSDASTRALKGKSRPILPARQRAETVAALACVDWVVVFRGSDPRAIRSEPLRPDVLAKGSDWSHGEIVGAEEVESWGGRVVRLRVVPGIRTSLVVDRIRSR